MREGDKAIERESKSVKTRINMINYINIGSTFGFFYFGFKFILLF